MYQLLKNGNSYNLTIDVDVDTFSGTPYTYYWPITVASGSTFGIIGASTTGNATLSQSGIGGVYAPLISVANVTTGGTTSFSGTLIIKNSQLSLTTDLVIIGLDVNTWSGNTLFFDQNTTLQLNTNIGAYNDPWTDTLAPAGSGVGNLKINANGYTGYFGGSITQANTSAAGLDIITNGGVIILMGNNLLVNGVSLIGTVSINNSNALGNANGTGGTVTLDGCTLYIQKQPSSGAQGMSVTLGGASSSQLVISAASTIDLFGNFLTVNLPLSGSSALTIQDTYNLLGVITFTSPSSSSFLGQINITSGTLQLSGASTNLFTTTGSGTISGTGVLQLLTGSTVANSLTMSGGAIDIAGGSSTVTSTIGGTGSFPIKNTGTTNGSLTVSANITNTGTLTIATPDNIGLHPSITNTLAINPTNLFFPTSVIISSSAVFQASGTGASTISATISGSGTFLITGSSGSTTTISGTNTSFTGTTTLTSGTVSISSASNLGTAAITGNGATLITTGSSAISLSNSWTLNTGITTTFNLASSAPLTLTGAISTSSGSGTSQILNSGAGALTLTPSSLTLLSNLQTNGNSISTGTISGSGGLVLGASASTTPDVLTITGASTYSGAISNNDTGSNIGSGAVVITAGTGNTVTFSGTNTFTGGVTLNSGTLSLSSQTNLSSSNVITGNGGTLKSAGSLVNNLILSSGTTLFAVPSITASSISGSGAISLEGFGGGLGTLTIAGTSTYSGVISNNTTVSGGTAAVVIAAGTTSGVNKIVILSGTNTFSGGLTLTSGTLEIDVAANIGSASATITGNGSGTGATLRNISSPSALITIANPWTFNAGNTTSFGGAISLTGAFSVSSGSGTATITKLSGSTLTLQPSSLNISSGTTFATNGNNITVTGANGLATGSGTLALGKTSNPTTTDTLTIQATTAFSGVIANNGSGLGAVVIAAGSGNTVTLSGTNTFTGGLTLTSGTLSISTSNGVGGTSNLITFNGGTLSNSTTTSIGLANPVTFNGGTSSPVTGGPFALSGPFTVTAGTASIVNSSTSLSLAPSSLTMAAGSTLAISGAHSTFSITGPLTITGTSGTVTTITNSGGSVTLAPSVLTIATGSTFAAGSNNISVSSFGAGSGTLSLSSGTLTIPSESASSTFSGAITGAGGVLIQGQVGFSGVNTFSGGLSLSAATNTTGTSSLTISAANQVGTGTIVGNGGSLITTGSNAISLSNPWIFNAGSTTGSTLNTSFSVGSSAPLTLTGAITAATGSGTALITVVLGSGVLTLTPSALTINSTALQIVGNTAVNSSISTGSISGSGNLILGGTSSSAIGTLTIRGTSTYSGVISDNPTASSGAGAVVIAAGSDTVAFSGIHANTFSGGLTLTSGTLSITVANQVSTGTITGNGGALLTSGSSITLSNPITLNVSTSTTFSSATSGTTLTLNGPISIAPGTTGTVTISPGSGSGTVTYSPSSLTIPVNTTFATNGNSIQTGGFGSGSGTLSLGSATALDTLTIAASSNTTFAGNIVNGGAAGGSVVINSPSAPVNFTGATASTFSHGLTLTAGTLTITAANQVGTGTITGRGGSLTSSTAILTLTNNLALSTGTTTTFIVPNITVNGSGSGISGSGGLALGGILTIQDGSTYPGIISDASATNTGSVVIDAGTGSGVCSRTCACTGASAGTCSTGTCATGCTLVSACTGSCDFTGCTGDGTGTCISSSVNTTSCVCPVTFTGVNPSTFTGGLTLTSGTLVIGSSINLGTGTLTGNGGTLQTNITTTGNLITNNWNFIGGTTTSFNVQGATSLTLGGVLNSSDVFVGAVFSVASGVAELSNIGTGTLNLNPSSLNIATGSTLQLTDTNLNIGSANYPGNFGGSAGTLNLAGSPATILTVASSTNSQIIFTGNITGTGSVVIHANVSFFGQNTFSGGLTLASTLSTGANSQLTITPSASAINQLGTGTIIGSGGGLVITANLPSASNYPVPNDLHLTGGTTTTFSTTSSAATLTFTGPITTVGSGTATILTVTGKNNGPVIFGTTTTPIPTLTVATGMTLATNGSSITMGTFGSGSGTIRLGTTSTQDTLTILGGTSSFSGIISEPLTTTGNQSGGGAVNVNSSGIVTFSGQNTFSGGLTLTGGTLSIGLIGNTGYIGTSSTSGNAITFNGGTLSSASTINFTYNPITFTGGSTSTFAGGGSFTLNNSLSITGSQGTTATISNPAATLVLTPSSLDIASNVTFATNGNNITVGANGFGSSTNGTLALGLISGISTNIDTLTITTSSNTTFGGNITNSSGGGIGAVNMNLGNSSKTLTFTGANTFSGGLTLTAGSLAISGSVNGSSISNQVGTGTITGSGGSLIVETGTAFTINNLWTLTSGKTTTIEVDNTGTGGNTAITSLTLSGVLSGAGGLNKTGAGTLILSAVNTYTGNTTVSDGTLTINGSIYSTGCAPCSGCTSCTSTCCVSCCTTIDSGALMNGYGSTHGNTIVYGAIAGGNSIGTFTFDGDVVMKAGSFFLVEISPSAASELISTGFVTIEPGSQVTIVPQRGLYTEPLTYIIAEGSGGYVGTFDVVKVIPGVYLSAIIFLDGPTILKTTITPESLSGGGLAQGSNAISVATAIDEVIVRNRATVEWRLTSEGPVAIVPPELPLVIESLVGITTAEEMTYALNQLHPAPFKGMTIVQQNNAVEVREALTNRMQNEMDNEHCFTIRSDEDDKAHSCKKEKRSLQVWANGLGDVLAQDSNTYKSNPEIGYQSKMAGVILGIDKRFAEHFYVGALGGYTSSHINWKENHGTGNVNSGYAGLYASAIGKMFYGNASATVGWNEFNATRNIIYPGVNLTAKNDHLGTQLLSHLDTGVNIGFKGITLRPFDSFDYVAQRENSYTETNAGEWNLHVKKTNAILIRNELGLQFAGCVCFTSSKWTIAPKLSWVREVRVKGNSFVAEFADTDSTFEVVGYYPDRSLLSPGVAVSGLMLNDKLTLGAYYNGEFRGGYSSHNYGGELRFGF